MANEKRLISADAVLVGIATFKECYEGVGLKPWVVEHIQTALQMVERFVKETPAVDAVEVVHSKWDTVFYERNGTLASYSHLCPECKYLYRNVSFKGYNYCPNCGAKMDGGM